MERYAILLEILGSFSYFYVLQKKLVVTLVYLLENGILYTVESAFQHIYSARIVISVFLNCCAAVTSFSVFDTICTSSLVT